MYPEVQIENDCVYGSSGPFVTCFCYTKNGIVVYKGRSVSVFLKIKDLPLCHYNAQYHLNGGYKTNRIDLNKFSHNGTRFFLEYAQKSTKMEKYNLEDPPKYFKYGTFWVKYNHLLCVKRPKWHLIVDDKTNTPRVIRTWRKLPQCFLKELEQFH